MSYTTVSGDLLLQITKADAVTVMWASKEELNLGSFWKHIWGRWACLHLLSSSSWGRIKCARDPLRVMPDDRRRRKNRSFGFQHRKEEWVGSITDDNTVPRKFQRGQRDILKPGVPRCTGMDLYEDPCFTSWAEPVWPYWIQKGESAVLCTQQIWIGRFHGCHERLRRIG